MSKIEAVMLSVAGVAVGIVGVFMLYLLFVWVPVAAFTEAVCLRAGYPKYHVAVTLERYCSNLEGSVTIRVDKAQ